MTRKKKGLSMRKIREIFRLSMECGMTNREIAKSMSVSHTIVNRYLGRAKEMGLSKNGIATMDDHALKRVFSQVPSQETSSNRPQPDWAWVHQEMKKKGVTLTLLWEEYRDIHPDGYRSTQFCELYRRYKRKLSPSMRQSHKAGKKMFTDYAGQTMPIVDGRTGLVRDAEIFVAVLGASNYTYAEATWDQSLPNWIGSHIRSFEYFGGVSEIIVPDNLKSGVSRACRYEPDINPTYHDMAVHYGTAIIPARVRRPKDKAKVEVGVQIVERWILAVLRNRTFFNLAELNEAIFELLERLNEKPFKKLKGSRRSWFESMERDMLKPLPKSRYELAEWKKTRVNIDYHVEFKGHYYSVPYRLVREEVELRSTARTVEVFKNGKRIASHKRNDLCGHTTHKEHMPKSHQRYLEWTPSRMNRWAGTIGPACAQVVETVMEVRIHPEQGFRSCLGILRLEKAYSRERLEAACNRAIAIGGCSYRSVKSILENGLDKEPLPETVMNDKAVEHNNIRGCDYYN